jgi:hypothetical protein
MITPRLVASGSLLGLAAAGNCTAPAPRPSAPQYGTDLNGVAWPELCLEPQDGEEHFFIIGDWGGLFEGPGREPITAWGCSSRPMVTEIDPRAQILVAEQMNRRAISSQPRYVINIGDNFYWDGVKTECGASTASVQDSTLAQWTNVFENVYRGPGIDGKVWMGVLGNHDFGGYKFTQGWDQAIAYTWGPTGRWLTPALYWSRRVSHPDFSIDYIFMDSNVNDAFQPSDDPNHNICSEKHNHANATCGVTGPTSVGDCFDWFFNLWEAQIPWAEDRLAASDADWRVIVTHFPPDFRMDTWRMLSERYHVDLIITGHRHQMEVHHRDPRLPNTAWVVSGGGGGICSEGMPSKDGQDDQYGFMDVTISKTKLKIEAISHSGIVRSTTVIEPGASTTTTSSSTATTTTTTRTATATDTATDTATTTMTTTSDTTRRGPFRDATGTQISPVREEATSHCPAVRMSWSLAVWSVIMAGAVGWS